MASDVRTGLNFLARSFAQAPLRSLPRSDPTGLPIRLHAVAKGFGARGVLHNVDLAIDPGQFIAIVGRSGSGKSTLLRLLAGLERPDGGQIYLGGMAPDEAAGSLRVMFQDGRLLPWRRVIDNVALGLSAAERPRAITALRDVGLEDRAREWPRVLSGGQRQRVALARALAANPRLILLDEPLGALDALTRLEMQGLIETVWRQSGFTAVLVTHDVAEAALLADRILLVEDGGIAMDLAVDLPRPRRAGPALAEIEAIVLERLLKKVE
jgi:sulfonate transport system ATP-binding protein